MPNCLPMPAAAAAVLHPRQQCGTRFCTRLHMRIPNQSLTSSFQRLPEVPINTPTKICCTSPRSMSHRQPISRSDHPPSPPHALRPFTIVPVGPAGSSSRSSTRHCRPTCLVPTPQCSPLRPSVLSALPGPWPQYAAGCMHPWTQTTLHSCPWQMR